MADIEMVIKIPESAYDYLSQTVDCIANGTPLPKGQGRLIERVLNAAETLKQKTGHWILDETNNSITCDKCGCLMWASDICHGDAHYCPNCGARMESEDKNE